MDKMSKGVYTLDNRTRFIMAKDIDDILFGIDDLFLGELSYDDAPDSNISRDSPYDSSHDNSYDGVSLEEQPERTSSKEKGVKNPMEFSDYVVVPGTWANYTGPIYGWKYWLPKAKEWGITITEAAAVRVSGVVKRAWLWYENGKPVRELTAEEIVEYCP